ncbi:hypothetical protein ABC356_001120 [Salmonella enterica]|uniref:Uncharacterized protein n=1 Tax=Salmonella diarizonae TaxID=59204 RepID=A0A5U3D509_SALDZ|nr:hypothetical protein [Salmonella enterica subsp. diarizonae]ECO1714570.1 hypothetical protein [Salmonella enterica]EDE4043565.1 hypothetical protein [Salmonella enterica subsp. enterica serovar Bareilly]EHO7309644.1 hypothetical protein [Salmonella enterica subsp. enterica serovar Muenchen]EBP3693225.1 hypothetical protein [Salmonella enterica subsp. diarizonae]
MKQENKWSGIKEKFNKQLDSLKKLWLDLQLLLVTRLNNGLTFFWYAFFIGAGLTLGFFFTVLLMLR